MSIAVSSPPPVAPATFGRPFLRKLAERKQDAVMVVVGDSISATYNTYVGKVVDGIAARHPALTVKYGDWTLGNENYNALSTKQTGNVENPKTLTVYNCAVSSQNPYFQMAPYFDTMIASKQPDLVIYAHSHNLGPSSATALETARNALVAGTQQIARACPEAEIVMIPQNPRLDASATIQAERLHIIERICQLSGFGFVNTHRLFLDADPSFAEGKNTSPLMADEIHPNAAGYTLMANEILRLMSLSGGLGSQQRPTLDLITPSALLNSNFAEFAAPPTLTSWTATNVTLSKDTTNFESPNGYSVKVATTTPGTNGFMFQNLGGNALKPYQGGWVTFQGRVRIPSGQVAQTGRLEIQENNGSHQGVSYSRTVLGGQGAFRPEMAVRRIATDCTSVGFRLFCSEGAGSGEFSVDHVNLVPGIWPKDIR